MIITAIILGFFWAIIGLLCDALVNICLGIPESTLAERALAAVLGPICLLALLFLRQGKK